MAEPGLSRAARALLALERQSGRRWFLPGVGVFPLCDYILPFLPNQILLAGLSMILPHRWIALAATFAVATAAGATLIAAAIQTFGALFIERSFGTVPDVGALAPVLARIETYGLPALIAFAMLPWPPRTAVFACAVAGLPPLHIGLAVLAGRVLPAAIYAGVGAKAPHMLRKFAKLDRLMREVEAARRRIGTP